MTALAHWQEGQPPSNLDLVANTAFNRAGQMTTLASTWGDETRTYDPITLQLTAIQVPGSLDLSYVYPAAGTNNGRTARFRTADFGLRIGPRAAPQRAWQSALRILQSAMGRTGRRRR